MRLWLKKLTLSSTVAVALAACATPSRPPTQGEAVGEPVREFLRSAASSSQQDHNYAAAVNYYQSLHARDPEDMDAVLGLARNLRYIGSAGQAIRLLEEGLDKHPERTDLRAELGKSMLSVGRTEDAIDTLRRVTEARPDDWEALSALGIAYDVHEDFSKAQKAYRAALEISPDNVTVLNNLALSKALSGEFEEALALLRRASRSPRSGPQVRQNLALMHAMRGDLDAAERLMKTDLPAKMAEHNIELYRDQYAGLTRGEDLSSATPTVMERIARAARAETDDAAAEEGTAVPAVAEQQAPDRTLPTRAEDEGVATTVQTAPEDKPAAPPAPAKATRKVDVAKQTQPRVTAADAERSVGPRPVARRETNPTVILSDATATPSSSGRVEEASTLAPAAASVNAEASVGGSTAATELVDEAVKVQLGVFSSRARATKGMRELRAEYVELFDGLAFDVAVTASDDATSTYKLVAGPVESEALAADLCTKLHSLNVGCTPLLP